MNRWFCPEQELANLLLAAIFLAMAMTAAANECVTARQSGDPLAMTICQDEWQRARQAGDVSGTAEALFQLAMLSRRQGEFSQAADFLEEIALLDPLDADWTSQYRLAREKGILSHVQRQPANALGFFRSALALARGHDDLERVARSLNDLGNAYRHIGASRQALDAYVQSLTLKRANNDEQIGTTLNNIADLFADLGEPEQAEAYYRQALAHHQEQASRHHLAHTLESMAHLARQQGDLDQARRLATESLDGFDAIDALPDQLRLATLLAQLSWRQGDEAQAEFWLTRARQQSSDSDIALPPAWFNTEAARLSSAGQSADALEMLLTVEPTTARWPVNDRLEMLGLLSALSESAGHLSQALAWHRTLNEESRAAGLAQRDQDLNRQRVLLEVAEHQRQIEQLENESALQTVALKAERARTLSVGLAGVIIVGMVVLGASGLQRHRSRQEQQRRARIEATLNNYRQAAESLRTSQAQLRQLLDASRDAMLSLGADNRVMLANSAACELLGMNAAPQGEHIDALFRKPVLERLQAQPGQLQAVSASGRELVIDMETLNLEEELQVVMLRTPDSAESEARELVPMINRHFSRMQAFGGLLQAALKQGKMPEQLRQRWQTIDGELQLLSEQMQPVQDDVRNSFRRHLVDLMVESLAVWEKCTGRSRVDLAEESRIWRVTIDEGRLRTRAMDRYLKLSKLPRQPRWREVVRTAYFVLGECPEEAQSRLEPLIEKVQQEAQHLGQN
jgi:two-component system, sensor histidine kinase ChiS